MIGRIVAKRNATNEIRLNLRVETHAAHSKRVGEQRARLRESAAESAAVSLVYSSEVQETKEVKVGKAKRRFGFGECASERAFTVYGRKTIKEACAVLESIHGTNILFVTLTVPARGVSGARAFATWSGYALLLWNQRLRDVLPDAQFVSVWEWQKRGALHLHVALASSSRSCLETFGVNVRKVWWSVLDAVGKKAGVDMLASEDGRLKFDGFPLLVTDAQWIKKSLGRYLSKYISKGAVGLNAACLYPPPRWWSVDKKTLTAVHQARETTESVPEVYQSAADFFSLIAGKVAGFSEKSFWYESKLESGSYFLVLFIVDRAVSAVWEYLRDACAFTERAWGYKGAGRVLTTW